MKRLAEKIFITATDTGVGKTLVSGLLLDYLRREGTTADYQKWVSTGDADQAPDLAEITRIAGPLNRELDDHRVPYRFALPASPHLAADREGRRVDPARLLNSTRVMEGNCEFLIIEGVGGVLVPLNRDLLLVDLAGRLKIPALMVSRSGLGTINHTLLTIEALNRRRLPVAGLIFSDEAAGLSKLLVEDNMATIAENTGLPVLGRLPFTDNLAELKGHFTAIGRRFIREIRRPPNP